MATIYYKDHLNQWTERIVGAQTQPVDLVVHQQHPFPIQHMWKEDGDDEWQPVDTAAPLPVQALGPVNAVDAVFLTSWEQPGYGATSGAHDANDALGDPVEWAVPRFGKIVTVNLIDIDDDTLASSVHIFSRPFVAAASDAAFTISVADARWWVTSQVMGTPTDIGGAKVVNNVGLSL